MKILFIINKFIYNWITSKINPWYYYDYGLSSFYPKNIVKNILNWNISIEALVKFMDCFYQAKKIRIKVKDQVIQFEHVNAKLNSAIVFLIWVYSRENT